MANIIGAQATAVQLYLAFYGGTPSTLIYNNFLDTIEDIGAQATARAIGNQFAAMSNTALAAQVLANVGISASTTNPAAFNALSTALAQAYAAFPNDRGVVTLNLVTILSNLEGNATYGNAAAAFNANVLQGFQFASGATPATSLTDGLDNLLGTSGNDNFVGVVFDNQNTFQSGDHINGGAGWDTLMATLGVSSAFAIAAITENVEVVTFRSQSNNSWNDSDNNPSADPADGSSDDNIVDAQDMRGVHEWWNTDSRADLVIEDVRINDDQITEDIIIGWANADPSSIGEDNADKVDFEVYFSPESLRKESATTSNAIRLSVGNQVETPFFDPAKPLDNIPYDRVAFLVNGQPVTLTLNLTAVDTYDQLFTAVQTAFNAAKAAGEFADDLANVTLTRSVGTDDFFSRDGVLRFADEFVLTNANGTIAPATTGWSVTGGLPSNNAFSAQVIQGAATTTTDLITSTIYLDNVGRESESGDLIVGSMSTRTGVEKFEITVLNNDNTSGEYTSSGSWLGNMRSTNNFLREVVAVNGPLGTSGPDYLYVGTGMDEANNNLTTIRETFASTQSTVAGRVAYQTLVDRALLNTDGLIDVRLFDASAMTGQVKVGAHITEASIEKYQDLIDTANNATADDAAFTYKTGTANDSINLLIDGAVVGFQQENIPGFPITLGINPAGLEPAARNDFTFLVDGGAGNDHIQVVVAAGEDIPLGEDRSGLAPNWYDDQKINKNITINGGAGDDIIRTPSSGDKIINGGTGADTIYSDNTGFDFDSYILFNPLTDSSFYNEGRAAWVFNAVNSSIIDLQSQTAATVNAVNAQLTVTFRGLTKQVSIGGSVDSMTNVAISDLTINQAIKNAINNDPVLSKLLVAEDGAGRTLVVRSLIDGDTDLSDLAVTFQSKALTTSQAAVVPALSLFDPVAAATLTDGYGTGANGIRYADGISGSDIDGADSWMTLGDNTITPGTENDVIVLSTTGFGEDGDQLLGSNETVVYNAAGFGNDTIVNFDSTWIPAGAPVFSGAAAVAEKITVTFGPSDGSPAAQTIIFDGTTVNLSAPAVQGVIPAVDVAFQFFTQFDPLNANWTATHTTGTNTVTLTRAVAGALTDVVAADFTGTYFGAANGNGTVTVATTVQGADAIVLGTQSTFDVNFDVPGTAADAAGDFTFDGSTVAYAEGDGAVTLANKLMAADAAGGFANWTLLRVDADTVRFTAIAPGATPVGVAADFDIGSNNIVGSILPATVGTANVGTPIVTIAPAHAGQGADMLDFRGIGGDLDGTNFQSLVLDKSIVTAAEAGSNDTAAEVAALFTDSATAMTHVYVAYNAANVGNVYAVVDAVGTGAGSVTATLVGTIDLADTPWASLTAVNFL